MSSIIQRIPPFTPAKAGAKKEKNDVDAGVILYVGNAVTTLSNGVIGPAVRPGS
jgi:hypothetical protein